MSPELEAFLTAEDLDDVLSAREKITALASEDEAVIRSILQQWQNAQAVSNLLFHPKLIPEDLRIASLFRGLTERRVVYLVLAAVVGFQSIEPTGLNSTDRERIVRELLAVVRDTTDILAQRASVSVHGFAGEPDAPQVFALMGHPDKTVQHNLRAWLFRTFQSRGVEPFAEVARRSGATEDVQRRVIAEFTEFVTNPPESFKSPLFSLFGYIPNLRDVRKNG